AVECQRRRVNRAAKGFPPSFFSPAPFIGLGTMSETNRFYRSNYYGNVGNKYRFIAHGLELGIGGVAEVRVER
ncbi:hypothetical protein, partial [Neorhizobium sp. T6_25]|uniref:hypothetical protein n=1 Tax=Neorhizobium sp. T6_25 TaxID=2093833 RepID=UPI00197B5F4C